jgi:hypothetical protein
MATQDTRGLTGPRTKYRHKVPTPISIKLTAKAITIIETDCASRNSTGRTGMRRSDYIEELITKYGHMVPSVQNGDTSG